MSRILIVFDEISSIKMTAQSSENNAKLVGVEISNSVMTAVRLDTDGNLVESHQVLYDQSTSNPAQIVEFINELKHRFGGGFECVGIAVPGLVRHDTKRIAVSTLMPEHSGVDLVSALETATALKITIENDANAAAYGEFKFGAGRGSRNMFYATLGSGVGGAIIFDGQLWRGVSGFAGELGYLTLNSEGMKLEEVASSANILRRTRSRISQDSTSSLDEEKITLTDIIREANEEDDFAQMMLERTGNYVGTAIAGVINLLNIEKVVVGGEIMQAGNLVLDAVISRARELTFTPSFETVTISAGELGEKASAIGAAILANESN